MSIRKRLTPIFRALLSISLFFFTFRSNAFMVKDEQNYIEAFLLLQNGGVNADSLDNIVVLIVYCLPYLFFFYCYSLYFREDIKITYIYVFTRTVKRSSWLLKKTFLLFVQQFIAWLVLFLASFLWGYSQGLETSSSPFFYITLFFSNFLPIFFLSFLQNILSLRFGSLQSFILVVAFYFGSLIIGLLAYDWEFWNRILYAFFPPVGTMYLWYDSSLMHETIRTGFIKPIAHLRLSEGYIACVLWFFIGYAISRRAMNQSDLSQIIREDF